MKLLSNKIKDITFRNIPAFLFCMFHSCISISLHFIWMKNTLRHYFKPLTYLTVHILFIKKMKFVCHCDWCPLYQSTLWIVKFLLLNLFIPANKAWYNMKLLSSKVKDITFWNAISFLFCMFHLCITISCHSN